MANLTNLEEEQLRRLWESGDRVAWLDTLRRLAPSDAAKLPTYLVGAIEGASNAPAPPEAMVPDGCSPAELARYAAAGRDEAIYSIAFADDETGLKRVEEATGGMLQDLMVALDGDSKLCSLLSSYWAAVDQPPSAEGEEKISNLWDAIREAFDPILVGLFGEKIGRGFAGTQLRTISMHLFKNQHSAR